MNEASNMKTPRHSLSFRFAAILWRVVTVPLMPLIIVALTPIWLLAVAFDTWRAGKNPQAEPLIATWANFKVDYRELWLDAICGRV